MVDIMDWIFSIKDISYQIILHRVSSWVGKVSLLHCCSEYASHTLSPWHSTISQLYLEENYVFMFICWLSILLWVSCFTATMKWCLFYLKLPECLVHIFASSCCYPVIDIHRLKSSVMKRLVCEAEEMVKVYFPLDLDYDLWQKPYLASKS